MVAALVWSYGAIAFRALTGRRTSGLLILTAAVLTGRTVVAAVANSTFLYFLQPIISDGVVATGFLLSLATARPIVARLAGDFYPMDHELSMRPRIQRLFLHLTAALGGPLPGQGDDDPVAALLAVPRDLRPGPEHLRALAQRPRRRRTIAAAVVVGRKEGLLGPVARRRPGTWSEPVWAATRMPDAVSRLAADARTSAATRAPASTTRTPASRRGPRATWSGR